MPRGGKRPGAGRPSGQPNRDTAQRRAALAELVAGHVETAVAALAKIAASGESEAARISAATALLDRAYGRPAQAMALDVTGPPVARIERIVVQAAHFSISPEAEAEIEAARDSAGNVDCRLLSRETLDQVVRLHDLLDAARG